MEQKAKNILKVQPKFQISLTIIIHLFLQ